jgi:hypothetical protein
MMKALCCAILLWSLFGILLAAPPAAAEASDPCIDEQCSGNSVKERIEEYRARIELLFKQRLDDWSRSFLARRHDAMARAGEALAAEASAVHAARRLDWSAVGNDPEFRAYEQTQVEGLLEPKRLRAELTTWARGVEMETRNVMIELFRQLVAEDLGLQFDQQLRGQVVRAVNEIPLESLVKADAAWIETRIRSGLPQSVMTKSQRAAISMAAGALAGAAAGLATAASAPTLTAKIAALAMMVGQWVASLALDALDNTLAGPPQGAALATQLEIGLREWQDRQLRGRLENILHHFGDQSLDLVKSQVLQIVPRRTPA